jgi:hypothetical protein
MHVCFAGAFIVHPCTQSTSEWYQCIVELGVWLAHSVRASVTPFLGAHNAQIIVMGLLYVLPHLAHCESSGIFSLMDHHVRIPPLVSPLQ